MMSVALFSKLCLKFHIKTFLNDSLSVRIINFKQSVKNKSTLIDSKNNGGRSWIIVGLVIPVEIDFFFFFYLLF